MQSVLAARSDFSIGESTLTIEKLIEAATKADAKVVGLTDTMSITSMIDFTNQAKKAGMRPIIGCRLRLVDDPTWRKSKDRTEKQKTPREYFVTYYARSQKGVSALYQLLSRANDQDHFYFNAKLGFKDLFEALSGLTPADCAITTSDTWSILHHPDAEKLCGRFQDALPGAFYLQLTAINTPLYDTLNVIALDIADNLEAPCIVMRPSLYAPDEADAHEVALAIAKGDEIGTTFARSPYCRALHLMGKTDFVAEVKAMIERLAKFRGVPADKIKRAFEAVKETDRFLDLFSYEWVKQPVSLPKMADDEFAAVVQKCKDGFKARFSEITFGHQPTRDELTTVYKDRLAYELSVLKRLNFSGYFLLVEDVVQFAKKSGILVGPGRGSVGGSLVAYLMGITDCDPIRFGLLFERFINPDRIDLPDADLDFMSERRHEVVTYIIEKYGTDRVAGVSNYNTLGTASSIRDVAKACGLPELEYRCSKFVPKKHGQNVTLDEAADQVAEIKAFATKFDEVWGICKTLEGTTRSMGQHAAGLIVGGVDLVERAVIERRKEKKTGEETTVEKVVCWDKRIVEDMGLVKMDILGLSTLDLIGLTLRYIRYRHSKRVDIMKIPLDDPKVLDNFAKGITTGIFQFESGGMRRLLKELGKDGLISFDDITAATALYRPGPMESGMMDSYWKRKQGLEPVDYDHPLMRDILSPTFGVMVYQEQVMQVSRVIAGYSAPDADKLRKIMGKKLPEEMKKERSKFVDGCVKTIGCDKDWAGDLFDKIEGFAGYGFNKSHSVEYTLISYQCMYLKTFFPVEFVAAALTLMKEERLPALLAECTRLGIEIVLPDVNVSTAEFEILTDTKLAIPLSRVKGISDAAARLMADNRKENGPFKSKLDFETRCRGRLVHKGKIESLDAIGAFASVEPDQVPARHPSRIKSQRDLIPGLIADTVPVTHDLARDRATMAKLVDLMNDCSEKLANDGMPVAPTMGKDAKFMVISDAPSGGFKSEEEIGKFSYGRNFDTIHTALTNAGLARSDGYWTGLIKRPKAGKQVTPDEIALHVPYLKQEIELLKPPVIVLLGSTTVRHFLPDFKGKASDSAGTVIYAPTLDANFIVGFSPGEIFHDPEKQNALNQVFATAASLVAGS